MIFLKYIFNTAKNTPTKLFLLKLKDYKKMQNEFEKVIKQNDSWSVSMW